MKKWLLVATVLLVALMVASASAQYGQLPWDGVRRAPGDFTVKDTLEVDFVTGDDSSMVEFLSTIVAPVVVVLIDSTHFALIDSMDSFSGGTIRVLSSIVHEDSLALDDGSGDSPLLLLRCAGGKELKLVKLDAGGANILNDEGAINILPSNDADDYIVFSTTGNATQISNSGGGDGADDFKIITDDGDLYLAPADDLDLVPGSGIVELPTGVTRFGSGATDTADFGGPVYIRTAAGVLTFSGATSASILSDSDVLTIGGVNGAAYNENATFDFESTENTVTVGTGTGVTDWEFGTIDLNTDNVNSQIFDTDVVLAGMTLSDTTLAADGTQTHINIAITPKGSGVVILGGGVSLAGDLIPTPTGTYDLGSQASDWDSLFVNVADIDGNAAIGGDLDVVDNITAGDIIIDEASGVLSFTGANMAVISTGTEDLKLDPAGGDVSIDGGLTVGSDTDAGDNNLRVEGTSALVGATTVTGNLTVNGGTIELPTGVTQFGTGATDSVDYGGPISVPVFTVGDTTTGDADGIIYFADDGSATAESFMWDDGNDRFELTDDLYALGITLGGTFFGSGQSIYIDQIYMGYGGANCKIQAYDTDESLTLTVKDTGNILVDIPQSGEIHLGDTGTAGEYVAIDSVGNMIAQKVSLPDSLLIGGAGEDATIVISQEEHISGLDSSLTFHVVSGVPTISGQAKDASTSSFSWLDNDTTLYSGGILAGSGASGTDRWSINEDGTTTNIESDNGFTSTSDWTFPASEFFQSDSVLVLDQLELRANTVFDAATYNVGTPQYRPAMIYSDSIAVGDTTTGDNDAIIYFADDADATANDIRFDDGLGHFTMSNKLSLLSGEVYAVTFNSAGWMNMAGAAITATAARDLELINYQNYGINIDIVEFATGQDGEIRLGDTGTANEYVAIDSVGNMIAQDVTVNGTVNYAADAQADDDYEIAIPGVTALTAGLTVTFLANTANTGGATLEITSVGDLDAILKMHDQALATGDIEAGQIVVCVFDGTNWQMTSQVAQ